MGLTHQPCPDCPSSDALQINDDGSTYCHSCNTYTPSKQKKEGVGANNPAPSNSDFIRGVAKAIPERGLDQKTCSKYKYNIGRLGDKEVHVATYRDLEGNAIFQKIRFPATKEFSIKGKYQPLLYGMHLFKGNNKKLIITEGEIDCLSIAQVVGDYPVVSIPSGVNSAKDAIKHNLKWVEQFEEVVLCFDMDEHGQKAIQECVPLLSLGKVKVMSLPLKDANEMLKAGRIQELYKATWNASEWRPDGIISQDELWEELKKPVEWGLSYPWESLTEMTYGIRKSEMIVFGAGTGMGKTEFFKEIEHHLLMKHNKKVGIIHLEEKAADTARGLMGKQAGIRFHIPDAEYSEEDFKKAYDEVIRTDRAVIYNGYGTTDFDIIKNVIRYMAKAKDCEYIFLDHVTAFADGIGDINKVNQLTRNYVLQLANLTRELDIGLFTISHLRKSEGKTPHEEGGRVHLDDLYGAAALKQWVSFAIGLERNQQADNVDERHTTTLRVLKDRYSGQATGNTISIKYDENTGRLMEVADLAVAEFTQEDERY